MKFEIVKNGEIVDSRELGDGSYKIGRAPECAIQLISPQVSKNHALLVIKDGKAAIVDLGSANGVFINGILIKKQRVKKEDEVVIADYHLRIATPRANAGSAGRSGAGNLAENLDYAPNSEPELVAENLPPQERLLQLLDQKILVPFYGMMKTIDWRVLLFSILAGSLVFSVLLSVIPVIRWGKAVTIKESLARAHTVAGQTVRENYRILSKTNDFTRLTVEAAESEVGMLSVLIIDPKTNAILAPAKFFNKSVNDVYSLIAIKKVIDGKEDPISVDVGDGTYIVAQPIYQYTPETNERNLSAMVLAQFQIPPGVQTTIEPLVEASLFAILLSLAAYFLIFKMFTRPILQMQEQLDAALKGEDVTVSCDAKFPELETLATVINFSINRINQANGGAGAGPIASGDPEQEDELYLNSVKEFEQGSSDGLVCLDKDKKVTFVGKILEELIGMRNEYAVGQNITEACRDASFVGTAVDLCEQVFQSLGSSQSANLDINGTARTIYAVPHKNSGGEIRFILLTVKMNG